MTFTFCDDLGPDGFGWIADEPMTRASHVLASEGRWWLVDPLDWGPALERARELGEAAGVVQLLDRHDRDCAALAERLGVPHWIAPDEIPHSPFEAVAVKRWWKWKESALWWPATRTLVAADALGTNVFYTGGTAVLGVHVFLRLTPPRMLDRYEPERILVGHGEGVIEPEATRELRRALETSRRGLPGLLVRVPRLSRRAPARS